MAKVTNHGKVTPIGLPGGVVIAPGETVNYPGWAKIKDRQSIAHYLETGVLHASDEQPEPGQGPDEALRKQALLEQLKALGINANGNSKADTLQAKLDEALADKAKAEQERQDLEQALNAKTIAFEPSQTNDELRALLAAAE
ncbi:hypothetical protein RRX38_02820 [Pseudomonas sp. DTU_2021_1001937_2_SI_NGA_ILE_001]|uniref:hypothetical protein n=1 Tax=Pseudomonas sp. DTU_2021_1001937_2_SI_NGA_ILE_001 TaxID=3077589 RepID=UPI0028FC23FD|nr:hypothetical protein [Pseudomonas sp. DTU_2021_1001937_2_SI_NGA_ILE_001]WNW10122.1 hypothetical protein RRX38_02820 [Pseudomonas sp. DTU_2021_1001937_2_SI_NGA_ILE_001]